MGQRWVAVWDINVVQTKKKLFCVEDLYWYRGVGAGFKNHSVKSFGLMNLHPDSNTL